jgi:glycosyltransferase involved in cell wall biosynthesis
MNWHSEPTHDAPPAGTGLRIPRLVSVVVPMKNEQETIGEFYRRTSEVVGGPRYELVFVDDGSTDSTPSLLEALARGDDHVRPVYLSRNFGHQAALTAGLDRAAGDVVISIDADLQDPPELIPKLIDSWRGGSDVVHAVRKLRHGEARWRIAAKRLFYRVFSALSDVDFPSDSGDFRLFDRKALDAVLQMRERHRFIRGMAVWAGYAQASVPYDRDARYAGETKYPLPTLFRFAIDGIVSFSNVPLQIATVLGVAVSAVAFLLIPAVVLLRLTGHYLPGVASIHILILGLGGVQLVTLGIVGVYVGRILDEVKSRPIYLVRGAPQDVAAAAPGNGAVDLLVDLSPRDMTPLQPELDAETPVPGDRAVD